MWSWLDTREDHQRWGVKVQQSRLSGLGPKEMGLFATRPFQKKEKITPYLGEELTLEQRKQRYGRLWGPYVYFKPWGHPSIDAIFYRGAAAFANDGAWILHADGSYEPRNPSLANAYLERGWLRADHDLVAGEEIFLNYGQSYWKNRFKGTVTPFEHPVLVTLGVSNPHTPHAPHAPHTPPLAHQGGRIPPFTKVGGREAPPVIPEWPLRSRSLNKTGSGSAQHSLVLSPLDLTPVEKRGPYWVKRDDLFQIHGARGGKARSCWTYLQSELKKGPLQGVITGGSRVSPQVQIVGRLAFALGLPARMHLPQGPLPKSIRQTTIDLGHTVCQWFPGFNHVLNARVKSDVKAQKGRWLEIPFGMEGSFAIKCTAHQVDNLPSSINRIILPVGSGMTLIGLLIGLQARPSIPPIVGVVVGKDPSSTLDRWLSNWRQHVTLVNSEINYHQSAPITNFYGIDLDPIYEAKVIPYLQPGDLLWLVGYHDPK